MIVESISKSFLRMNDKNYELACEYIPKTYVTQGHDAIRRRENLVTSLLSHRKIPEEGWDDQTIEYVQVLLQVG